MRPSATRIRPLVVAGDRPPGTPPAEIAVWVGEQLVAERVIAETPEAIRLALPETGGPGPIALTIQSTVFQPRPDPRDLGVRLYRVAVRPTPERPAPQRQAAAPRGGGVGAGGPWASSACALRAGVSGHSRRTTGVLYSTL